MTTAIHDRESGTIAEERASCVRQADRVRIRLGYAAGVSALLYAAYRGYYALGGTIGMFGTPVSVSQWRQINGVGAVLLFMAAIVAFASTRLWHRPYLGTALLAFAWVAAVGCVMHGLVDDTTRLLSMAGLLHLDFSYWSSMNHRESNLQDLFFNEMWFLVEGALWGTLGWVALTTARARRWWLLSALTAIAFLTADGVLTSFGVFGRVIVG